MTPHKILFNYVDAPEVKRNKELTVEDLNAELEKLQLLERNVVEKLNNMKLVNRS